jgi:hypothetical protein
MDCNRALYDALGRMRVRSQTRKLQSACDELAEKRKEVRRRLHSDFEGARTLPSFLAESAATLAYAREHGYVPTPDASDAERDTSDAALDEDAELVPEDAASSVSSDSDTVSAVSCSDDTYASDDSSLPLCVGGVKRAIDAEHDAVACQLRAAVSAFSASQLRKPGNTTVLQAIGKALNATQPAPGTAHTVACLYEALLAALDACLSGGRLADVAKAHRQLANAAQRFLAHGEGSRVVLDDKEFQGLCRVVQAVTKAIQQPETGRPRLYAAGSKARLSRSKARLSRYL